MIITGFRFTDVMNAVDCPTCGQPAGKMCLGKIKGKGRDARRLLIPHTPRITEYDLRHPDLRSLYEGDPCDPAHREAIRQYNQKVSAQ